VGDPPRIVLSLSRSVDECKSSRRAGFFEPLGLSGLSQRRAAVSRESPIGNRVTTLNRLKSFGIHKDSPAA
jgi:hypothetical protein